MSGYYNIPGIPEQVFLTFTDWIGYVKDDGSFGYILQNGVPVGSDWSTLTGKPSTFPPTIGVTPTTAKAGDYTPSWSEINSVIPPEATFPPILGTSAVVAKAGNWYPTWAEVSGKPQMIDIEYFEGKLLEYPTQIQHTSDLAPKLTTPSLSYTVRPLNTIFQVSASRPSMVSYSVELTVTASITGGQKGDVILEVSPSATFASGVQTVAISGLGQSYTLAIALQGVQPQTGCVAGVVPAGWYARLRTVNVTGTPSFTVRATQEATL